MKRLLLIASLTLTSHIAAEDLIQKGWPLLSNHVSTGQLYAVNVSGDGVYSETNSYYKTVNQSNSNNTYIDNSKYTLY